MTPTDTATGGTAPSFVSTAPLEQMFTGVQEQIKAYTTQREELVRKLQEIQREVQQALDQLGAADVPARRGRRPGRPAGRKRGRAAGTRTRGPGRPREAQGSSGAIKRGRRKMSAEARAKIAAAQKARWAKQKGEK